RGSIVLSRVDGNLHGQAVRGEGRIELDGAEYRIPDLRLVWGDAALAAAGVVGDTFDLDLRLDAPDLAKLLPDLAGSLSLEGSVEGPRASPGLRAEMQGSSLRVGTVSAKSVTGTVKAGTRPDDRFDVALSAAG